MSFVLVSELPQLLFDEQHADACNVKYHRPEDVFDLDKWDALVRAAYATGDLPTKGGGIANIVNVNDWLATGGLGFWSAFQLHDPLLPDMDGMFESEYAALPATIKERISLIFHFSPWDSLSPKERWDKVFEIDDLNTPKSRLRFALGDVVFWGKRTGPLQTLSAAAERELQEWKNLQANQPSEKDLRDKRIGEMQQWVNRIESLKDLMLIGCIPDTDDIGELVKLLKETVGQPWCRNVRFPVWLDQFYCSATVSAETERTTEALPTQETAITPDPDKTLGTNDQQPVIRLKRGALIKEFTPFMPSIKRDLSDASRTGSGLSDAAKLGGGFWDVEVILKWGKERGKINKPAAAQTVNSKPESIFAATLKQLFSL